MKNKSASGCLAKECIVTALIELMKTQDYHTISITDIARKAGVSRMTYYRNYTSKEDILNKYMEEVGLSIHKKIAKDGSGEDLFGYYLALFEQLGKYKDIGITVYRAHLGELILRNITQNMAMTFPSLQDSAGTSYRHYFLAGAFYNVFIEWLKSGRRESCAEMARICASLAREGCHPEKGSKKNE
ncbi:MAG: TetR/AcrR family transcriptional regulator [Ruminococcaceae bacterium]|nr:TetR/AcrR family transcriptional regulator [Oscillospiraceae bacterium]